jgi:CDP-glucose 4,6-dehydratase
LSGYLALAERLLPDDGGRYARAWNFGPDPSDDASVGEVAQRLAGLWGGDAAVERDPDPHWDEAVVLRIDSSDARAELGWSPRWSLQQALERTVAWQRAWQRGDEMQAVCREQIAAYGSVPVT